MTSIHNIEKEVTKNISKIVKIKMCVEIGEVHTDDIYLLCLNTLWSFYKIYQITMT